MKDFGKTLKYSKEKVTAKSLGYKIALIKLHPKFSIAKGRSKRLGSFWKCGCIGYIRGLRVRVQELGIG